MVSICPTESDPRLHVSEFISDPDVKMLGGLRSEGFGVLMDVVQAEVERQNPGVRVMVFSKDHLLDRHVLTCGDLKAYLHTLDWEGVRFVIFRDDICIVRWQEAFSFLAGGGITLFTCGYGCHYVPMCVKNENAFQFE